MADRVPAALRRAGSRLRAGPRLPARVSRPRKRLLLLLGVLGPGLIAANAGNDAGGVATYSEVGAKYGYDLLWMMVLITLSLAVVQMLAARMGAVTGKGIAELIREQYGIRWSVFATLAFVIACTGICISDFVGVGAALGLAGVPFQLTVPVAGLVIWLVLVRGSYRSAERIFIWMTLPFFAYPLAALLAHPDWGAAARGVVAPHIHASSSYLLLFIATAGTTITPYMQTYLQSAVVERGADEDDLKGEQRDAVIGAVFADLIAAFVIIATAATLFKHGIHTVASAADAARALRPLAGRYAELLFGVGLVGASLLAAAILPIAVAYVISESLGFEKGLSWRVREAPVFIGVITAMIVVSTVVAMVPGIPVISFLVGVQVINGILLPINLFFIWRLSHNAELMGERRTGRGLNSVAGVTVLVTSALSLTLVVVTVLGL